MTTSGRGALTPSRVSTCRRCQPSGRSAGQLERRLADHPGRRSPAAAPSASTWRTSRRPPSSSSTQTLDRVAVRDVHRAPGPSTPSRHDDAPAAASAATAGRGRRRQGQGRGRVVATRRRRGPAAPPRWCRPGRGRAAPASPSTRWRRRTRGPARPAPGRAVSGMRRRGVGFRRRHAGSLSRTGAAALGHARPPAPGPRAARARFADDVRHVVVPRPVRRRHHRRRLRRLAPLRRAAHPRHRHRGGGAAVDAAPVDRPRRPRHGAARRRARPAPPVRAAGVLSAATGPASERHRQRAATMGAILKSTSTFAISAMAILTVMGLLGLPLGPLLASAGVGGVALGFRRAEPGQGLPVRHLHDPRGPVRRRRRHRHRRGRSAPSRTSRCGSPGCATAAAWSGTSATARSSASATARRAGRPPSWTPRSPTTRTSTGRSR